MFTETDGDLIPQLESVQPARTNDTEPQPLPPIEAILAKGRSDVPIYGIYCWGIDYPVYRDAILGIGFKNIRTAGRPFDDEIFTPIATDGLASFVTLGLGRKPFASDEEFVEGNIQRYLEFLGKFGPDGSFFHEHPEVPYHPITAIELYNEPNFQYMVANDTPIAEKIRLYTMLQVTAYPRIKEKYPTVKVIGFGAGGASAADIGFIRGCFKENPKIAETMDVLSTHPYMDPSPFTYAHWLKFSVATGYNNLRAILKEYGKENMPIWYTELGWFITPEDGGFYPTCKAMCSQTEQAACVVQMYALGLRLGIDRITNMYIMDTDNCNPGFVNRDGSWRVSAYATKVMIDLMPNPRLTGAILDGQTNNDFAYTIEAEPDGEEITMVFNATKPSQITIPWAEPKARITDMLGHAKTVSVTGGKLTLDAGPCALYIRHVK